MKIRGTTVAIVGGSVVLLTAVSVMVLSYARTSEPAPPTISETPALQEPITFVFVGDMMFDRHIRKMARAYGEDHILSCVLPTLISADITIGNLEGPITTNTSVSEGSVIGSPNNFRFTFPPATAALLARSGFDVVSLGNNHIGDFGGDGALQTRAFLDAASVGYFGGLAGDEPLFRTTVRGTSFSFIAYNQFGGNSPEQVAQRIQSERAAGSVVIVFAHWGDEYVPATPRMREIALQFADAGASLIVGAHPHVVQESTMLEGVPVYYSLGNFVFDQYWNDDVATGQLLQAAYTPDTSTWTFSEQPVRMYRDGRTCSL